MSNLEEEWKKLVEFIEPLDDQCREILGYLSFLYPEEIGFNKLFKDLKKNSPKIAKSTLSKHLRHLSHAELIVRREDKKSRLKIKPQKYSLSPDFVEIVKDTFLLKVWSKEQILGVVQELRLEEVQPLTISIIDIFLGDAIQLLEGALKYRAENAGLQRQVIYNHFENVVEAYRMRVSERNEKEKALKTIREFNEFWVKARNEKWRSLIETMRAYKQEGGKKQNE